MKRTVGRHYAMLNIYKLTWWFIFEEENKENENYNIPIIVKSVGLMYLLLNKICQYVANKLEIYNL